MTNVFVYLISNSIYAHLTNELNLNSLTLTLEFGPQKKKSFQFIPKKYMYNTQIESK